MAKLKGEKKLNKAISLPLKKRFGIDKARLATSYAYYFSNNSIDFQITRDIEDDLFAEFLKERFDFEINENNNFVFSLLHEVGHAKANEEIEGMIYDFCLDEKKRIENEMQTAETEEQAKILEFQYFALPDEIMATQWAVNYARKHPKIFKKLIEEMNDALFDFYKKNGLFESED